MKQRRKVRKTDTGRETMVFSERSGMPFRLKEMVVEPGTGLIVHQSECDYQWNSVDWNGSDPVVPADAQKLRFFVADERLNTETEIEELE